MRAPTPRPVWCQPRHRGRWGCWGPIGELGAALKPDLPQELPRDAVRRAVSPSAHHALPERLWPPAGGIDVAPGAEGAVEGGAEGHAYLLITAEEVRSPRGAAGCGQGAQNGLALLGVSDVVRREVLEDLALIRVRRA